VRAALISRRAVALTRKHQALLIATTDMAFAGAAPSARPRRIIQQPGIALAGGSIFICATNADSTFKLAARLLLALAELCISRKLRT